MNPSATSSLEARDAETSRLYRAERTMIVVRWIAVVFAFIQVVTFYEPYPKNILQLALGIVAAMAAGNAVFSQLLRRPPDAKGLRRISIASLSFDVMAAQGLIWAYAFDPNTAIFAIMYLLPLSGAIRFQRRGAMAVTAAASILYTLRDVYGAIVYDTEFLVVSITYRCGIAFLIAYVAGTTASELLNGRRVVEQANHELLSMNRSMREFVSIASHDMRTPVSVISGLSSAITRDGAAMSDVQKHELIQVIHRRSLSLDRLVNDLLATSSIDAGILPWRPERVDICDLLDDIARHAGVNGLTVDCEAMTFAHADPEHVRRITMNLLTNAQRYGSPPIKISARYDTPSIHITVSDSGTGVPLSFIPRLYEKFARAPETARKVEGTGLGLSIVKGLTEQNGGTVSYEQNDGGGATFSVTLPEWTQSHTKNGGS